MVSSLRRVVRLVVAVASCAGRRWRAPERPAGGPLALVVGLPKMGTTSLRNYFHCSGYRTSHQACSDGPHCGQCVSDFVSQVAKLGIRQPSAIGDQTKLFRKACGAYDAFTQLDSVTTTGCVVPQVAHLKSLLVALPTACFVLNTRPVDRWLASVEAHVTPHRYANWSMFDRMVRNCPIDAQNGAGLAAWARAHVARSKDLVARSRCGVVVDIEAPVPDVGAALAATINDTHARCWGQANARPKAPVAPGRRRRLSDRAPRGARRRRLSPKAGGWRTKVGDVDASCAFAARAGLDPDGPGPELVVDYDGGSSVATLTPGRGGDRGAARVARAPRLCRSRSARAPDGTAPALLMAASDVDYLFFHWPYFLNAGVYAAARRLPVYLWLGELPGALRDTVGPTCARSRWRADRGFDGPNSNHYTKVVAAALLLDVGGVPGVLFRDMDMFAVFPNAPMRAAVAATDVHDALKVDVAFPCTSKIDRDAPRRGRGGPPRGFRLKSTKFYLRDSAAARDLLDAWLDHRCGPKDQIALWYATYALAKDRGCLNYDAAQLVNMSYAEAYHTERPGLNYLFKRCRPFRFACGRQFVMPDVLHEGAFPRADGVDVPIHHRERTMRVVPRRDGSPVLDAAYRASLGLDALDGP